MFSRFIPCSFSCSSIVFRLTSSKTGNYESCEYFFLSFVVVRMSFYLYFWNSFLMFCSVSKLDAFFFLGVREKPFLIGISLTQPRSIWLVNFITALAKAASKGLSLSLKINVHDAFVVSVHFCCSTIACLLAAPPVSPSSRACFWALSKNYCFWLVCQGYFWIGVVLWIYSKIYATVREVRFILVVWGRMKEVLVYGCTRLRRELFMIESRVIGIWRRVVELLYVIPGVSGVGLFLKTT